MKLSDKLLKIFEEYKGEYFKGDVLAEVFDVSRSAVWKAVNELKAEGHEIESSQKRGYALSINSGALTADGVKKYLRHEWLDIEVVNEATSTNSLLKAEAERGAAEGRVIFARTQTEGRGRQNRTFFSPEGQGLYFSLLLRPVIADIDAACFTALAGVAVAEAIEENTGIKAGIKWVNDIMINGKKVCGILSEAGIDVEDGRFKYVVIGIGINLTEPENGYGALKDTAAALFGKDACSAETAASLAACVLDKITDYYYELPHRDFVEPYRERQTLIGKSVELMRLDEVFNDGVVLDVNDDCEIIIEHDMGIVKAYSSGEVRVIPDKSV